MTRPYELRGVCDGVDAVISCAGAPLDLKVHGDRRSYSEVDAAGNRHLLAEAGRAGVKRFVYVSVHGGEELVGSEYAGAHEDVVAALRESGLSHSVVRPTGYFAFFGEILRMARLGLGVVMGSGLARTNPVHEADVAEACVRGLTGDSAEVCIGGPEIFTRREIVELAVAVAGTDARIREIPAQVFRAVAVATRPFNPRVAALMRFGVEVSGVDMVAPALGTRRLRDYFESLP